MQNKKQCDTIAKSSETGKMFSCYGGIAQLGERLNGIQEVSGSIPLISTKKNRQNPHGCWILSVFCCNPKTMGYAHGSKKAEADE